jgi:hypothetical protein
LNGSAKVVKREERKESDISPKTELEGFAVPGQEEKVCRMLKSLYGFMPSGRNWAKHLNKSLGALEWVRSRADPVIRTRTTMASTSIIAVYTDDVDGISTTEAAVNEAQVANLMADFI